MAHEDGSYIDARGEISRSTDFATGAAVETARNPYADTTAAFLDPVSTAIA